MNAFLTAAIGLVLFWMVRGGFRDVARRFEQVDRRFERMEERLEKRMDDRFDRMDDRFTALEGRIHEVRADITGLAVRLIGPQEAEGGT